MNTYRARISLGLVILFIFGLFACMPGSESVPSEGPVIERKSQAIIGGTPDNRYPSIGSLQGNRRSFCTGTLIASRLVISAGHCIASAITQKSRGVKIEYRIDMPDGAGGYKSVYHEVLSMQSHPKYKGPGGSNSDDMAVMVLKKDVQGVTPMPINTIPMDSKWVGRQITYLGYGLIQTQPSRKAPGRKYGIDITMRRVEADRFTTQDSKKSICSGDSGGPALYKVNGQMVLIGVNSYVQGGSTAAGPLCNGSGTSFRIDYFLSWLQPLINQHGGKCKTDKDCGACYRCDAAKGKCIIKGSSQTATFCGPCIDPTSCGGSSNLCVRQKAGNRCLQACDSNGCCPLGTICQDIGSGQKQCVPDKNTCADVKCKVDKDCGPGEACANGTCKPKVVPPSALLCKKCKVDKDCGAKSVCRDYPDGKYCTQPCVADNFCPSGYSCESVNNSFQCVSTSKNCKCAADADCHTGFTCQTALCKRVGGGKYGDVCDTQRKCATGFKCLKTPTGSSCYKPCKSEFPAGSHGSLCNNGRCNSGGRCFGVRGVGYVCLKQCTSDTSCTFGGKCTAQGNTKLCSCTKDSDCKAGNVCNKSRLRTWGTCSPKNTAPANCGKGYECVYALGTDLCLPEASRESGQSCDASNRCKNGLLCARTNTGSLCIRFCSGPGTCAEGGSCVSTGRSSYCSCHKDKKCKEGYICNPISKAASVCTPGKCKKDEECGANATCKEGICKQKAECTKDEDCSNNQLCKEGKCVAPPVKPEPKEEPVPEPKEEPTSPAKEPAAKEPAAEPKATKEVVVQTEPSTTDAGSSDKNGPTKPPAGCGSCSLSNETPTPSTWWLLFLLVPLTIRRKKEN